MRTVTGLACPFLWMALIAGSEQLSTPVTTDVARFQYTEVHMGMQARIVLYTSDEATARRCAAAAFRRIGELDAIMSDYRKDSELNRLCSRAGSGPVVVSADLFRVLWRSQMLAKESEGAFDVTIGPLVQLWRQARRSRTLPDQAQLATAHGLVGWRLMELNPARREVTLRTPGMRLDLGGIAKGYACDEALAVLRRHGLRHAMVEMGGDIVLGEAPPGRTGWTIEIPNAGNEKERRQELAHVAVSTSGDTEQFVEIDGVRYSHIVDPRTGLGLTNRMSVTVIAPWGWLSDGLSTTICVLGEERGRQLAQRFRGTKVFMQRAL